MTTGTIIVSFFAVLLLVGVLNLAVAFRSRPNRTMRKAIRQFEKDSAYQKGYNQGYVDGQEDRKTFRGRATA